MPLYEYHCDRCDDEFESIESIKDRDKAKCPKCDRRARRLVSGFAVGSGGGRSQSSYSSGDSCSFTSG